MGERKVVLEETDESEGQAAALLQATQRAERAEAEVAKLKHTGAVRPFPESNQARAPISVKRRADVDEDEVSETAPLGGEQELRKDSMMAHLLDSLDTGKDIGHYGRLVFAMVARHFLPEREVIRMLTRDKDFSREQALLMLRQVENRDYNPPKRDRILEWQSQQGFPILPNPEDPDCGNLYRNLKFPTEIYEHIEHYQEEKLEADE